ncbi:anaphase-promoting complex subunit Hcn1 [Rhizoclosmatium sp. JEL0117]|nr:anaphase-promoting complex subunit Hcn1 [Rhizoclosmatium sp. JEL0117]
MVPQRPEEFEREQQQVRRIIDPIDGRSRLVKGTGEIIEEIVSRERHHEINKQATKGDGAVYSQVLHSLAKDGFLSRSLPLHSDEALRVVSTFIERFEHLESQMNLFRPIVYELVQLLKPDYIPPSIPHINPKQKLARMPKYDFPPSSLSVTELQATPAALEEEWVSKVEIDSEKKLGLSRLAAVSGRIAQSTFVGPSEMKRHKSQAGSQTESFGSFTEPQEKRTSILVNLFGPSRHDSPRGSSIVSARRPSDMPSVLISPNLRPKSQEDIFPQSKPKSALAGSKRPSDAGSYSIKPEDSNRRARKTSFLQQNELIPDDASNKPKGPSMIQKIRRTSLFQSRISETGSSTSTVTPGTSGRKEEEKQDTPVDQITSIQIHQPLPSTQNDMAADGVKQPNEEARRVNAKTPTSPAAVISLSELWLIPLGVCFDYDLPLFYSCIVSIKNLLDFSLEWVTMRYDHPAMISIADANMDDWRDYYIRRRALVDFSATNMFPVGYHPSNPEEQLLLVGFVLFGAGLYACIVGAISSIAMGFDASGRLYKQKIDELNEYMSWRSIDPITQKKLLDYFALKYRGKYFDEGSLLSEMNESLRMEIAAHNCKELISKVPFLKREQNDGRDDLFAGRITSALQACYYVPGDIIFVQGEIGHDMYFIFSGAVIVNISGKGVCVLRDGAFFGEIALIANIPRTATVQAVSNCILYRLTQESFNNIVNLFDDIKKKVSHIYNERMERTKREEDARKVKVAAEMVNKISFLQIEGDTKTSFIEKLASVLYPVHYSTEDVVFMQGESADEMESLKSWLMDKGLDGSETATCLGSWTWFPIVYGPSRCRRQQ